MARYGYGSRKGYQAESTKRDSAGGKGALIFEVVSGLASSDAFSILTRDATPYYGGHTTTLQYFTTGAALCQEINHCLGVWPVYTKAGAGFTTTTQLRVPKIRIVNSATTLAVCYTINQGANSEVKFLVVGKTF
jgi:hypothetical protein